jgi:hypothetical protein
MSCRLRNLKTGTAFFKHNFGKIAGRLPIPTASTAPLDRAEKPVAMRPQQICV